VIAYLADREIGAAVVRTADKPTAIRLTPDRRKLTATGNDLYYVMVEALDKNGVACPLADNLIRFRVDGPGEIAAVDNGNPVSLELFQANERKLFFGNAMLIVRIKRGPGGEIHMTATSEGLSDAVSSCRSTIP
jgi:beta-galactosidase